MQSAKERQMRTTDEKLAAIRALMPECESLIYVKADPIGYPDEGSLDRLIFEVWTEGTNWRHQVTFFMGPDPWDDVDMERITVAAVREEFARLKAVRRPDTMAVGQPN
jgi:hypothetical protein